MKRTAHGEHLVQLTLLGFVNAYLVREEDGLTLVDTTMKQGAKGIVAAAAELGAPIRRIALTHGHVDHAGGVDALLAAVPDAELLVPERDWRIVRGDRSLDAGEAPGKIKGGWPTVSAEPARFIAPGDRIGSLEVVASPGHTPGHVAFLDTRDRTLTAGDAFQTKGGVAVSTVVRPLFPFPGLAGWDRATSIRSAEALRALDPSRLAVGHGGVLESPAAAMDAAIRAARG